MDTISVNKFSDNLKSVVEQVVSRHEPLKEILRSDDPSSGLGKPESLKHNLSGLWSKRISQKDRLIYRFDDKSIYILAIGGHYDQP
ncbi:MAG: Txe/YoeB family addiction module toxin [Zhongshania sp.]|uniref:Txe/YoeB family addiction module toxin n=1 Tax=Zhongshania sp. TaxID=1971902 RepID=UPI00260DDC41|nr:Txe/YoeB family addiction module toxin [Zhongshania sp.]MDF1693439.1 Txe/YoeB family addiction module toxin [Zhongshania sp.]